MPENKASSNMGTNPAQELVIERVFNAPRELVFKAWTNPEHLVRWWGPLGWTTTIKQMEVRPGGVWHYCMHSDSDGTEACGKGEYREIVEPERIVYLDSFTDADGNVLDGMPQMLITVEFMEYQGKTKMVSRAEFASAEERKTLLDMGMVEGLNQSLDRLEELLATL